MHVKCAVCKAHFELNRAFKVILIGVGRNPERVVVVMYSKVDLISETYEDYITYSNGKKCKFVDFNRFKPVWRQFSEKGLRISAYKFILPETSH